MNGYEHQALFQAIMDISRMAALLLINHFVFQFQLLNFSYMYHHLQSHTCHIRV